MKKVIYIIFSLFCASGFICSEEVNVLEEARRLREGKDRESYLSELKELRKLGLSASDAVSFINGDNLSSLYIKNSPEKSRKSAIEIFQSSWKVNSKYKFFQRLNERYYGGVRDEYIKVLELISNRDDINGSIEELTSRENWEEEFKLGIITEDDFFNLTFLTYNSHLISYRDIELFEMERLSTFIKWGFSASYLTLEEAEMLLEDLSMVILNHGGDWRSLGESYVSGIAFLFCDRNYFKTALRRRATAVHDILKRGVWENKSWNKYYSISEELMEKGVIDFPSYAINKKSFPKTPEGLDPRVEPLFDRERDSQSVLNIYKNDYELYYNIDTDNFKGVVDNLNKGKVFDNQLHTGLSYISHSIGKDPDILKKLIEYGFNPDLQNAGNKAGALHVAVREDDPVYLADLINYGANLNILDDKDTTPLGYAIKYDHYSSVDTLLKSGANPLTGYIGKYTPLGKSVRGGKDKITLRILEDIEDADLIAIDDWNLIHVAARYGSLKIVEALIKKGADLNSETERGYTPLHLGVLNNSTDKREIVELLIRHSDDINKKNHHLRSPLEEYLNSVYYEVYDYRKENELDQFSQEDGFANDLEFLLSFNFSLTGHEKNGVNPLWYLRWYGTREQIERVMDNVSYDHGGAGYDIGFALIKRGYRDLFLQFLEHNRSNIDHRIDNGYNLTYKAFSNPDYFWAGRALVRAGANINNPGFNDYNVLSAMAIGGLYKEMIFILDNGLDINLVDGNRKVPVGDYVYEKLIDINTNDSIEVVNKLYDMGYVAKEDF